VGLTARRLSLDMQFLARPRVPLLWIFPGTEKSSSEMHVIHLPTLAVSARAANGNLTWNRPFWPFGKLFSASATLTPCA
jgi:hypothetical protein